MSSVMYSSHGMRSEIIDGHTVLVSHGSWKGGTVYVASYTMAARAASGHEIDRVASYLVSATRVRVLRDLPVVGSEICADVARSLCRLVDLVSETRTHQAAGAA